MCRKNIRRCEKAFVTIGLFLAIIEISVELGIFEISVKYEPERFCCGLVLGTDTYGYLEDNSDLVISPPCDIKTIGKKGFESDDNNYCIVDGVVCDIYGNGNGTLSSCLSQGGYVVPDLCSESAFAEIMKEFKFGIWMWLVILLFLMIYTIALDLGDLFEETVCCQKLEAKRLKPHCKCFKTKIKNSACFWCFQLFAWLVAGIYSAFTANAVDFGYQNIDINEDSGESDSNSTAIAIASPSVVATYVMKNCNSDSSPIIATFEDLGERTESLSELSNIIAPLGIALTVVGVILELYHLACDKDDDEVGGNKQQMEMQIQSEGAPVIQTTGYPMPQQYAMPQQQNVVYMPQQQNVVYYPAQQQVVQPVVQYAPQQNIVYVQPVNQYPQ